ncbi:hypothetical protein AB2B38_005975 [Balneola sp. MJW-20]|uniref:hypothetical protein n=1 Tax=Gracilimonas aurantiaca TaxID=3234185 RepID=UPI0039090990
MIEEQYMEMKQLKKLLCGRKTGAKCLECGGSEIILLTKEEIDKGIEHRECGGRVIQSELNVSFNMGEILPKFYDLEGNRINKE